MATKKSQRSYKGADWYLLEHSQTLLDQFADDQADFEAYDTAFANPFAEDWQQTIGGAVNYQDDTATQADIAIQTGTVKQQMELCRLKYDDVIYFAQKAFGKNAIEIRAFGKGTTYTAASRSQGKMHNFMDELHQAAEKHKLKLIAAGFTQLKIDEIATLRDSFQTANRNQNSLKTDRPEISQGRLNTYNTLYNNFTAKAIAAAQLVYRTNPAKLNQYTYKPPVKHRYKSIFEATLIPGQIIEVETDEDVNIGPHWIVTLLSTDSDADIYCSTEPNTPPQPPTLTLLTGKKQKHTVQQLVTLLGQNPERQYVLVKNTGTTTTTIKITYARPPKTR